jgi:hypothetical protein
MYNMCLYDTYINKMMWQKDRLTDARPLLFFCLYNSYLIYRYKTTNKFVEKAAGFINTFLDLPQHVSTSHCHQHGVVVTSEAAQVVCFVDAYGLRPVQSGQLSRDVTKCVQWVTSLSNWPLWTGRNSYTSTTQTAWVASEETMTPWWWQWLVETCWGKSRNALIKSCYFLDAFVGCFITILQRCSVQLSRRYCKYLLVRHYKWAEERPAQQPDWGHCVGWSTQ